MSFEFIRVTQIASGDGIVFSRIDFVHSDRVLSVIGLSCFQSGELRDENIVKIDV